MKKIIRLYIFIILLIVTSCANKANNEITIQEPEVVEPIQDISSVETTEETKEYTFEDFENEMLKCAQHYYTDFEIGKVVIFDTYVNWDEGYIWIPIIYEPDGKYGYGLETHFIQYKDNPLNIYHGNDLIWKDGQPYGTKTEFGRGYPELLQILDSQIRIRQEHNIDSDVIKLANPDEQYLYFDSYDDGQYIWHKVYLEDTKTYGWLASDKNDPWIGQLA